MIVVDSSALVASLTGTRDSFPRMLALIESGQRLALPSLVLYEWLRGPREPAELAHQERLLPASLALPFTAIEAEIAARFYRELGRPRPRQTDFAIAACALSHEAALWTLNPRDFADIPGLRLL